MAIEVICNTLQDFIQPLLLQSENVEDGWSRNSEELLGRRLSWARNLKLFTSVDMPFTCPLRLTLFSVRPVFLGW